MVDRSKFVAQGKSYMTKECYEPGEGEVMTIRDCREKTIPKRDGGSFKRLGLDWVEDRPSLDLDNSMLAFLIGTFGPDDDKWVRQKVYVFHDKTLRGRNGEPGGLALDNPPPAKPGPDKALQEALKGKNVPRETKGDPDDDIPF